MEDFKHFKPLRIIQISRFYERFNNFTKHVIIYLIVNLF